MDCKIPYGSNCELTTTSSAESACLPIKGSCPSAQNGDIAKDCMLDESEEQAAYIESLAAPSTPPSTGNIPAQK